MNKIQPIFYRQMLKEVLAGNTHVNSPVDAAPEADPLKLKEEGNALFKKSTQAQRLNEHNQDILQYEVNPIKIVYFGSWLVHTFEQKVGLGVYCNLHM